MRFWMREMVLPKIGMREMHLLRMELVWSCRDGRVPKDFWEGSMRICLFRWVWSRHKTTTWSDYVQPLGWKWGLEAALSYSAVWQCAHGFSKSAFLEYSRRTHTICVSIWRSLSLPTYYVWSMPDSTRSCLAVCIALEQISYYHWSVPAFAKQVVALTYLTCFCFVIKPRQNLVLFIDNSSDEQRFELTVGQGQNGCIIYLDSLDFDTKRTATRSWCHVQPPDRVAAFYQKL